MWPTIPLIVAEWMRHQLYRKLSNSANLRQAVTLNFDKSHISCQNYFGSPVYVRLPHLMKTSYAQYTPPTPTSCVASAVCIGLYNTADRAVTIWSFSVRQLWPWTVTLTSQKLTVKSCTYSEHLRQISLKIALYFSRNYNEQTKERTNEPTN